MIKYIYLINAILIFLLLFTVKNLFNTNEKQDYSIVEFEKKLNKKSIPKIVLNPIPLLSENNRRKLPVNTTNLFDFMRVYPEIKSKRNKQSTTSRVTKSKPNNIEKKIAAEIKKLELLGIICFNGKKIATIKIKKKQKTSSINTKSKNSGKQKNSQEQNLPSNPTKSYEENDVLELGFKVIKINKNSVILAKNGYKKTLKMKGND